MGESRFVKCPFEVALLLSLPPAIKLCHGCQKERLSRPRRCKVYASYAAVVTTRVLLCVLVPRLAQFCRQWALPYSFPRSSTPRSRARRA
eukprot:6189955-Pleurochrysis_carterae.AAC.4